jgi:Ulp1 family protease
VIDSFLVSGNNENYHCFDSNFLNYNIKNQSKLIEKMKEKEAIFIPYNYKNNHWLFAVGNIYSNTFHFSICNSFGVLGNEKLRNEIKKFFKKIKIGIVEHDPQHCLDQKNSYDCGVHVMCGIEIMIKDKIKLDPLSKKLTTININNFKNNLNLNNIPFRQRVINSLKKL